MKVVVPECLDYDFLHEVLAIDSLIYPIDICGTYESVNERYLANRDSYLLAIEDNKIIGYFCFFPIVDALYDSIMGTDALFDDNIGYHQICEYKSSNNLMLISIAIHPAFQNKEAIVQLTNHFHQFIKAKNAAGFNIKSIVATAISVDGKNALERLGFSYLKTIQDGYQLFCLIPDEERV